MFKFVFNSYQLIRNRKTGLKRNSVVSIIFQSVFQFFLGLQLTDFILWFQLYLCFTAVMPCPYFSPWVLPIESRMVLCVRDCTQDVSVLNVPYTAKKKIIFRKFTF